MGPFYGSMVIILVSFLGMFLYTTNNYLYSGGISLGIILLIHLNRKDVPYLKHFFKGKDYWILLGEYFVVSLLFFVASIMNGWWREIMVFLPILLIGPVMKSRISSERWQNLPVLFGNSSLGLKSGFRLYYPFWLLCLALNFIVSALDKPDVFLVLVYFYLLLISGFQTSGDSPGYIRICNSPGRYLKKKLLSGGRDYILLMVVLLPTFFMPGNDHFEEVGTALFAGLFLFLINQLIYPASGNSRLIVVFVQILALIVFVMGYFYLSMTFVLTVLFLLILITAFYRLKMDYLW